jgi:hypothetical protein
MAYTWQYYDLLLLGIAASMAVGGLVGYLSAIAMPLAITASGVLAAGLIGHGLFLNGPVDQPADLAEEVNALN